MLRSLHAFAHRDCVSTDWKGQPGITMDLRLKDKCIFVTVARKGIGRAVVACLLNEGARLAIVLAMERGCRRQCLWWHEARFRDCAVISVTRNKPLPLGLGLPATRR